MTDEQRQALRVALIAGPSDAVLDPEEAAAVMGVSLSWLRASDVPRANVAGTKYMKSQCLLYVRNRLSHLMLERSA